MAGIRVKNQKNLFPGEMRWIFLPFPDAVLERFDCCFFSWGSCQLWQSVLEPLQA